MLNGSLDCVAGALPFGIEQIAAIRGMRAERMVLPPLLLLRRIGEELPVPCDKDPSFDRDRRIEVPDIA